MKRKLLCTLLCITLTLGLAGCSNSGKTATPKDSAKETVSSGKDQAEESESEETESKDDDRNLSLILNMETSSDDVLPDSGNAQLFSDRQTLPIDLNNLMNYQVSSGEKSEEGGFLTEPFSQKIAEDTESDSRESIEPLYTEDTTSTTNGTQVHSLYYNKEGETERTLKEALDQGLWYIEEKYPDYDTFGLTDEEGLKKKNALNLEKKQDVCIRELYDEFGAPNYIWFFKGDDTTVSDCLEKLKHPETNDNNVNVASYCIGWKFKDYSVSAYVFECSGVKKESNEYYDYVSEFSVRYMPNTYETLEECYGENMMADFIKATK